MQLLRLRPAFAGEDVAYVTTEATCRAEVAPARFYVTRDANRGAKLALARSAARLLWIVLRERPDVVVSTGAAPGYLAIRVGALMGAKTIWIDSMANAEQLSLSGRMAAASADLCLTQWPHLAEERVHYEGAVL